MVNWELEIGEGIASAYSDREPLEGVYGYVWLTR
jgi:hypothetical protein